MSRIYVEALEAAHKDLASIRYVAHSTYNERCAAETRVRYVQTIYALEKLLRQIGNNQNQARSKRHG